MSTIVFFCLFGYAYCLALYSDAFARDFMLPLSAAAYSDQPQQCLNKLFPNATVPALLLIRYAASVIHESAAISEWLRRQITIQCDGLRRDNCSGYAAVLPNEKAIVLSFRGTIGFSQLMEEVKKTVFMSMSSWLFGGRISRYFHDGFQKIWSAGMSIDYLALKHAYPDYEVWVTGHSLGGSLASLAASYVIGSKLAKPSEVKLITFGQPRTGDLEFSITHNTELEYSFRVTHWRDIVPHIPFEEIGHYFHHNQEAFYKYNMTPEAVTVCPGSEDKRCSDGLWLKASIAEHLHYFGKEVFSYGVNGCV